VQAPALEGTRIGPGLGLSAGGGWRHVATEMKLHGDHQTLPKFFLLEIKLALVLERRSKGTYG